jgi:hypothetical protein
LWYFQFENVSSVAILVITEKSSHINVLLFVLLLFNDCLGGSGSTSGSGGWGTGGGVQEGLSLWEAV